MAIEDWIDPFDYPEDAEVECKFCGQDGLYWCDFGTELKLYNPDGTIHVCHPPSDDDFEDLT